MNEELLKFLRLATTNLTKLLSEAEQLAEMQKRFHGGELLKLDLTLGETTISTSVLTANGQALFADELFKTLLVEQKAKIAMTVCDLQTFLEGENKE